MTDKVSRWIVVRLKNGQMKEALEERVSAVAAHIPRLIIIIIIIIII
jgi:hypothetical protein